MGGEKGRKPYLTMVGIGAKSTSRSALLEHWGEQPISIPFARKWLKSSGERLSEKGFEQCSERGSGQHTEQEEGFFSGLQG